MATGARFWKDKTQYFKSDALLGTLKAFLFGCWLFCVGTLLQWKLAQLHVKGILFFVDNVLMSIVAGSAMLVYDLPPAFVHVRIRQVTAALSPV